MNALKAGMRVRLANGWKADIVDNMRGNLRMARVYGTYTEIGSVYSHDIVAVLIKGEWEIVNHTPSQIKLREKLEKL